MIHLTLLGTFEERLVGGLVCTSESAVQFVLGETDGIDDCSNIFGGKLLEGVVVSLSQQLAVRCICPCLSV